MWTRDGHPFRAVQGPGKGAARLPTVFLLALLVATLPLAGQWASHLITSNVLETSVREREIDKIGSIGKIIQRAIATHGERTRMAAKLMSASETIEDAMFLGENERRVHLAKKLDQLFEIGLLKTLEVTDEAETVLYRAHDPGRFGDKAQGWGVAEALSGVGMLVSTKERDGVAVQAIEPVYSGGKAVGTVSAGMSLDRAFFQTLSLEVDSGVALLARNGQVIADLHEMAVEIDKVAVSQAFESKNPVYRFDKTAHRTIVYLPVLVVDDGYVVMVQLNSASADEVVAKGNSRSALFGIVILVLSVFVGWLVLVVAMRPLRQLSQLRALRARAEETALEVTGEAIATAGKDEIGAVIDVLDTLTVRLVERNRELIAVNHQVESANRAKSQFLTTMSHEIRTPLNGVLGMVELMEDTPLNVEQTRYVKAIRSAGRSLRDLLGDILDLSKIEENLLVLEHVDFDLRHFINEVFGVNREIAAAQGLSLTAEIEVSAHEMVAGDMGRVRQVLSNLLGNAIKFTSVGSVHLRVECLPPPDGDSRRWWRFTVKDTGIGISSEAQGRLFKRFSQADASTTRNFGGSGLGLVISKSLVEIMGGQMHVDSVPGEGSCFWFDIPFGAPIGQGVMPIERLEDLQFPGVKILVAEDNDVNRMVVEALLGRLGAAVTVVENGDLARKQVKEQSFDIVLMDCLMPEMDGFEATRQIRRWESKDPTRTPLPIVALTANTLLGDREACLAAGMTDYVTKPVTGKRLTQLLWEHMPSAAREGTKAPTAPIAHGHGAPAFDPAVIQSLPMVADGSNPEFADQVLDLFLQGTKKSLAAMDQAFRLQQHDVFLRQVHTLRSSAARVGAKELALEAERQEHLLRSGAVEESLWHELLSDKFRHAEDAIRSYRRMVGWSNTLSGPL